MIQNKTLVYITAFLIVVCAFWNVGFRGFKTSKQLTTDNKSINLTVVEKNDVKAEKDKSVSTTNVPETVTVTEDSFEKQNTSEPVPEKPKKNVINTSKNCSSNYSGGINRFGVYSGTNVVKCSCKMVKSDGVVYETSQKIIQTFNHEPNHDETDCNKTCGKICDNFLNDFK